MSIFPLTPQLHDSLLAPGSTLYTHLEGSGKNLGNIQHTERASEYTTPFFVNEDI